MKAQGIVNISISTGINKEKITELKEKSEKKEILTSIYSEFLKSSIKSGTQEHTNIGIEVLQFENQISNLLDQKEPTTINTKLFSNIENIFNFPRRKEIPKKLKEEILGKISGIDTDDIDIKPSLMAMKDKL